MGTDPHSGGSHPWVSDGTLAGTTELSVLVASGVFDGVPNLQFVVLGDRALFAGRDANNVVGLWVTDGTAAGTTEIAVAGTYLYGAFSVKRLF